tara:strand:+ start:256 stop:633 length:378 start_codon:yes stop_codon:yes gene_type:complete
MAQAITVNQNKGSLGTGSLVVRSDATGFISTSDNAPALNRANTAGETISSMHIAEIKWTNLYTYGIWYIYRGSSIVYRCYGQGGHLKLAENSMRLETPTEAQANLVFTESGFGSIIIKMHKNSGE